MASRAIVFFFPSSFPPVCPDFFYPLPRSLWFPFLVARLLWDRPVFQGSQSFAIGVLPSPCDASLLSLECQDVLPVSSPGFYSSFHRKGGLDPSPIVFPIPPLPSVFIPYLLLLRPVSLQSWLESCGFRLFFV
ncbi:hypothetical protein NPIL_124741 [Nephila pilipes]|uniref:Uncharacterized protein n=1 Tax=Nephila pilipes TaxID=299642 RepID=A0A8X6U9F9_NEPPI|nr:hypothetical protein NPIL_124741 [Nephila pilipes]